MKKVFMYVGFGVIVVFVLVMALCSAFGGSESVTVEDKVAVNVPEGVAVPVSDSKMEAYRNSRVSTEQYFAQLSAEEDISLVSDDDHNDKVKEKPLTVAEDEGAAAKRVFGDADVSTVVSSGEKVPVKPRMAGNNGPVQMTPEQKLEYDRKRAEMVKEVLAGDGKTVKEDSTKTDSQKSRETLDFGEISRRNNDGIITSLDDDFEDPSVRYSSSAKVPFRCMFVKDQKLVDGQRVTVRLMEDYVADGVFVPANTHLAAVCKVSDRLELSVRSVEMNGRIIPLQLVAYDIDGMVGIYCPETSSSRNSRRASSDAISAANSTFGGLVGDLANTVLRTGATIAKSASGELSVKVVSGYEFYLVKSERL